MLLALILMNIIKRLKAYAVFGNIHKLLIICVVFCFHDLYVITDLCRNKDFDISLNDSLVKIQNYYKDLKK